MTTAASFLKHSVVPDVIAHAPEHVLEVRYDNGLQAHLGNELTPTYVKNAPVHLSWPGAHDANTLYTLCLTGKVSVKVPDTTYLSKDPDAPSRANPEFREFLHCLVVNIPGSAMSKGDTLVAYIGSGPPQGSGLHRYVWLVYKQQNGQRINDTDIGYISNTRAEGRRAFRIEDFAKKHNLGKAVAGNFYQAEYDDYVPVLHAQLGFVAPKI